MDFMVVILQMSVRLVWNGTRGRCQERKSMMEGKKEGRKGGAKGRGKERLFILFCRA